MVVNAKIGKGKNGGGNGGRRTQVFSLEHSKFETSLGYPHVLHRSAVRYNV